jgi:hypothetical protein
LIQRAKNDGYSQYPAADHSPVSDTGFSLFRHVLQGILIPLNRGFWGENRAFQGIHKPRVTGSSPVVAISFLEKN